MLLPRGWAMPSVETQAATWQMGGPDGEEVEATGLFMRHQNLSHRKSRGPGPWRWRIGFKTKVKRMYFPEVLERRERLKLVSGHS